MNDSKKIILSRALTNSGDQAWEFAVPVTLALMLPAKLDKVALVFFVSRLSYVLILPLIGHLIDRLNRLQVFRLGLAAQFLGVLIQAVSLALIASESSPALLGVILGGILSGLGTATTNIGVAQDLVPNLFSGNVLTKINSRIRQVDLFSEVLSPVIAGFLLTISFQNSTHSGILFVAAWNLISFFPEYLLVKRVLISNKNSFKKPVFTEFKTPLWEKLFSGWKELLKLSIAPAVFAYALLWLSALSPHGVLLTSFLKESWKLSELTLGVFRGLGAIFGLGATLLFPVLVRRFGLLNTCRSSIFFQSVIILLSLLAFHLHKEWLFLGLILFSRIGLYSFSLGEQQIRQLGIPEHLRGRVNSTATALTGIATLILLGLGSVLGSVEQFQRLVDISAGCVLLAAIVFSWGMRPKIAIDAK